MYAGWEGGDLLCIAYVKTQRLLQLELLQGSMLQDTFNLNEIIYVKVLSKVPKIQQVLNKNASQIQV